MALVTKTVRSSHVDTVGYDAEQGELHVTYNSGKTAVYKDVDEKTANSVMNAPSVGQALHRQVRGRFEHEYL